MIPTVVLAALVASQVAAFPFVARQPGVDSSLIFSENALLERALSGRQQGGAADCPFNSNHTGAAPYTTKYPYCGAKNGVPGKQSCTNNRVPASGDSAHYFSFPGKNDIRGPCPGLNTAANHNFLSHDGITTFTELVDMQQNVYGVGYDLAVLLATLGVGLDGDPVTEKLSIGCDATSRTASPGLGPETGLNGHNKFEGDTSLSRNDYFTANGDNFKFNGTLYGYMSNTTGGLHNRANMAKYRYQRYQQSLRENGNFYFGPKSLLLYGAASFLYELFPSKGDAGTPDQATEDAFFGATKYKGVYYFNYAEHIPANWYSRSTPYTIPEVSNEIRQQYMMYPVAFGGNTGSPNSFIGIGQTGPYIGPNFLLNTTADGVACLLYQIATENQPSSLQGMSNYPTQNFQWAAQKLNPVYKQMNLGVPCPLNYNQA